MPNGSHPTIAKIKSNTYQSLLDLMNITLRVK